MLVSLNKLYFISCLVDWVFGCLFDIRVAKRMGLSGFKERDYQAVGYCRNLINVQRSQKAGLKHLCRCQGVQLF